MRGKTTDSPLFCFSQKKLEAASPFAMIRVAVFPRSITQHDLGNLKTPETRANLILNRL